MIFRLSFRKLRHREVKPLQRGPSLPSHDNEEGAQVSSSHHGCVHTRQQPIPHNSNTSSASFYYYLFFFLFFSLKRLYYGGLNVIMIKICINTVECLTNPQNEGNSNLRLKIQTDTPALPILLQTSLLLCLKDRPLTLVNAVFCS